ncbi:MAG: hypothetical protein A2136_01855 [Chloroflexi bacterium RBG_16_54_11]|nr:MAG: hypothetical protein A2136_01855 [Chloroflexi bacterium RBG_16_54_11]
MGYALTHQLIYDCKLDPTIGSSSEGFQVERYNRPLGGTTFRIARVSQAAVLEYANYCAGEDEAATCYHVTPGDDHETCIADAEEILSTFELIPNPFLEPLVTAPNHWLCQDEAGVNGHCTISYSVPLNALAFTNNGEGWAAGDDGLIYRLSGQTWAEVVSPSAESIYDLSFSSATNGWAVGVGPGVLHWDGNEWSEILPGNAPEEDQGGFPRVMYAVDAASDDDTWMVGTMKALDAKYTPYVMHWDGTELRAVNDFPGESSGLNAVLILGENDVLAVGGSSLGAMSYRWDGSNWTPSPVTGADMLYALRRAPDGTVWAAGIEYARDQSDTRGALFRWDGTAWQKIALPPLTGGIYQLALLPTGQIALGGDFTVLWSSTEWQPIIAGLAGYGWIADIETDAQGVTWALTHSGNLFRLEVGE